MDFKDKVITIYSLCYDGDPDRIYTFVNLDKAIASIECSVRGYYGDITNLVGCDSDDLCRQIRNRIYELKELPCIPLMFDNLQVILYSWELDHTSIIHNVLSRCYAQTRDASLAEDIEKLFSDSVRC